MKKTTHSIWALDYVVEGKSILEEAFRQRKLKRRVTARREIKGYPNHRFISFMVFGDDQMKVLDLCWKDYINNAPQEAFEDGLTVQKVMNDNLVVYTEQWLQS